MQTSTLPKLSSSPWQRNDIQFPRLLAEIMAAGAIDENAWTAICQSMDLQTEELRELFDRAQTEWEQIKSNSLNADLGITPPTELICPTCGYKGNHPTEHGEGFRYLANHTHLALCANGPRQQELLKPLASYWEDLPPGSFSDQGTNVNVALLIIESAQPKQSSQRLPRDWYIGNLPH